MKKEPKKYVVAPFLKDQYFRDEKGRRFRIDGVWYKGAHAHIVDFVQDGSTEIVQQLVLDMKAFFDKGLITFNLEE